MRATAGKPDPVSRSLYGFLINVFSKRLNPLDDGVVICVNSQLRHCNLTDSSCRLSSDLLTSPFATVGYGKRLASIAGGL